MGNGKWESGGGDLESASLGVGMVLPERLFLTILLDVIQRVMEAKTKERKRKMTDLETKREKLAKLLALATGNANQAEAEAAFAKAAKMAEVYGLSLEDIRKATKATKDFIKSQFYSGKPNRDNTLSWTPVDYHMVFALAKFCTVQFRVCKDEDGDNCIEFFGHSIDVDIARHLRGVISRAMAAEWAAYELFDCADIRSSAQKLAKAKLSFFAAMASHMKERMREIVEFNAQSATGGTALVVAKDGMLKEKAKEVGFVQTKGGTSRSYRADPEASRAGREAGGRVKLQESVAAGGSKMLRLN